MKGLPITILGLVLLGTGCAGSGAGGADDRDAAGIRAALARSPASLYHYRAPVWWGRRVAFAVTAPVDGNRRYARTVVEVAPGWHGRRSRQLLLLRRVRTGWRIRDTGATTAGLRCGAAPPGVVRDLFGACASSDVQEDLSVEGPRETRRPKPLERDALVAFERRNLLRGHDSCVTYVISISRVDPRWGEVRYLFHEPYGDCRPFNGVSLVTRTNGRWREAGEASSGFSCVAAPPGVVRSLDGSCSIPDASP